MPGGRLAVILGVVTAVGLLPAPSAMAAFPGAVGRLAFDDGANVFVVQPNGQRLVQLTQDGHSTGPRWSANGRRIAFSRQGDIFVMRPDGTRVRRVTALGGSSQPAWSPDGTRIAFVHAPAGKPGDIWTVPAGGGTATQLTHDATTSCGDQHPVWSPLGGRIAFDQQPGQPLPGNSCSTSQFRRVVALTLATGRRQPIDYAWDPDFTADGNGLVYTGVLEDGTFIGAPNLYASDFTGSPRTQFTNDSCSEGDACFVEGAAAPTSAFPTNVALVWEESHEDGTNCVSSTLDTQFCYVSGAFPLMLDIDWQARQR